MSVLYELFLACELKEDIPKQVIDVIAYLLSIDKRSFEPDPPLPYPIPDHFFFTLDRWTLVLAEKAPAFAGEGLGKLTFAESKNTYALTIRAEIRNGIELLASFVHWLTPYIETTGFLGYLVGDATFRVTLFFARDEKLIGNVINSYTNPPEVKQIELTGIDAIRNL